MKLNTLLFSILLIIIGMIGISADAASPIYRQTLSIGNDGAVYTPQPSDSYYIEVPDNDEEDEKEEPPVNQQPQYYQPYPYYPYYSPYYYGTGYSVTVPGFIGGRGTHVHRNPNAHGYDYGVNWNKHHKPPKNNIKPGPPPNHNGGGARPNPPQGNIPPKH